MNQEQNDKGLKKAAKTKQVYKLPSNFTYCTMQKIEESIRLREKKAERRTLYATIAAALSLVACCITGLIVYFGETLREVFTNASNLKMEHIQIPSFYIWILIAIPLLFVFDRWMRKQYNKRHS